MSSSDLGDSSQVQNSENSFDSLLTFERVQDSLMEIKNNFMRETFLELLGNGEDKGKMKAAAILGISFLLKEREETDQFMERLKKGEVTVGEFMEFRNNRIYAIYCPLCLEQIKRSKNSLVVVLVKRFIMKTALEINSITMINVLNAKTNFTFYINILYKLLIINYLLLTL